MSTMLPSKEDLMARLRKASSRDRPVVLADEFLEHGASAITAEAVAHAWIRSDYPEQVVDTADWWDMFRAVGVHNDEGKPVTLDRVTPLTVFRACHPDEVTEHRFGASWTANKWVAEDFLCRPSEDFERVLVEALVWADGVLADYRDYGEEELVVDACEVEDWVVVPRHEGPLPAAEVERRREYLDQVAGRFGLDVTVEIGPENGDCPDFLVRGWEHGAFRGGSHTVERFLCGISARSHGYEISWGDDLHWVAKLGDPGFKPLLMDFNGAQDFVCKVVDGIDVSEEEGL